MAIYYDNFESYALGPVSNPFGNFHGGLNPASIQADNYVTSGSKCLQTQRGISAAEYSDGGSYSSGTLYVAFKATDTFAGGNSAIIVFFNGSALSGPPAIEVLSLREEADGTMSVFLGGAFFGSLPASNTGDFSFKANRWYWLQINLVASSVTVAGTPFLAVAFDFCVEGKTLMSTGAVTTTRLISDLPSMSAVFDHIVLGNGARWDEFTFDTLQSVNSFPNPGTPKLRASTGLIETVEGIDSAKLRFSTGLIELIISGDAYVYEA